MTSRRRAPDKVAQEILEEAGVSTLPVDVFEIARRNKVHVRKVQVEMNVSGALVQEGDRIVIGVNELHHEHRQRFTIAHELGHYFLHMGQQQSLFVDDSPVFFRDDVSSQATDWREIQANQFAAALLLPRGPLLKMLAGERVDMNDDQDVRRLAEKCGVSAQALTLRLVNLGLLGGVPSA